MSNPKNILGKFDTYAYHHILMVCDSTASAEALAKSSEILSFQHPRNAAKYSPRPIGEVEGGKYITLIDGTTDATFFITEASWANIIAPASYLDKGGIPQSTTMSTDGSMEIVEPMGANFLNRLVNICDELKTDPVGLVFLLKTIFVGHNTGGGSEMITTVRPMMFVVYDISAIFDSSGGKYKLEFVGLTNGMGKMPQPNKIFEGIPFKVEGTLLKTIDSFNAAIDDKYEGFKLKAAADFAKTLSSTTEQNKLTESTKFLMENYRKVVYKIVLDEVYQEDKYKAGDLEHIRTADKSDDFIVNYGPNIGIEGILNKLMSSSQQVIDDAKDPKEKFIYKIISVLRSTPTEFVIEYRINRYEQAISPYTQQEKDGKIIPKDGQSIEFDYIFTGKNVDIKSFDIKMEMGMAFFQMAATSNNLPDQDDIATPTTNSTVFTTGSPTIANKGKTLRGKTPLFLGSTISNPMTRNNRSPVDSASFQGLLERHAALENLSASMVIYGNPQLLDEMSILPGEIEKGQTEKPKKDQTINPRWMSAPTLIKVNIKMPVDANDVNTEYESFWYSGYYTLIEVENIFSGGEFTQKLDMFSIPIGNQVEAVTDKKLSKEEQEALDVKNKLADDKLKEQLKAREIASEDSNKKRLLQRKIFRELEKAPVKHEFAIEKK